MNIKNLQKFKLPDKSGVYFFLEGKKILYIGKATSLRDRVRSYFGKDLIETRGPLIVDMVFKAKKIDWQTTDSVLEALILEANLIKKYQPYYNTREKDDRSFNYVIITKEKLPKVIIMRESNLKNFSPVGKIFGPYTNSPQLREAMKIIRRIFPFLDDKSKNYLEFYKQINLVPDVVGKRSFLEEEHSDGKGETLRRQYLQNIKNIKLFFAGKKKQILKNLKKEMLDYSKIHEFEKAGEAKRQMFALQHINDVALLKQENFSRSKNKIEAYDIAHLGGKNMVGAMVVLEDGEVVKSEYKKFKIRTQSNTNDTGALTEVLKRRLAHPEWLYPNIIVVDGSTAQINATKAVLARLNIDIPIVSVVKNERHKPKAIMGDDKIIARNKSAILLANSEAHRFAIAYHKKMRNKNFL